MYIFRLPPIQGAKINDYENRGESLISHVKSGGKVKNAQKKSGSK